MRATKTAVKAESQAVEKSVAEVMVDCLKNEQVQYVFGLPGEENIHLVDALSSSSIRFVLTRDERGAAFMADVYGRLTGRAGVCLSTLGPGAINLTLGIADAQLDGTPLVALIAQAELSRLYKESHQNIDLISLFKPLTKWAQMIVVPDTAVEIVRKAFKLAQTERPGATAIILPDDVACQKTTAAPLTRAQPKPEHPDLGQILKAARILEAATCPVILAGHTASRHNIGAALVRLAEHLSIPVATSFMAKGLISDRHALALGPIGFMAHDYTNFGLDNADVVVCVGYDPVEYAPEHWNPNKDKKIIHIHRSPAEPDSFYDVTVGIEGDLSVALDHLADKTKPISRTCTMHQMVRQFIEKELNQYANDESMPMKPQRIVSDLRKVMGDDDIVLCDTGAVKAWMARLYPCYQPNTCITSNSLATMGFALPGAIAARLQKPTAKIVAVVGDGAFLMSSQDLETAVRERTPFVVLIWRDNGYGLIRWKQEIEIGHSACVDFGNPDFAKLAKSYGIRGYTIANANDLLPTVRNCLDTNEMAVIDCPVDYSENAKLMSYLGQLIMPC